MVVNVTVKTLDSQNHIFDVEEELNVKQFKEFISPTIGIPVDQQRLIFRGRVLQDDKKISEYNVANNVVHVVQRPANQNNSANDEPPARPNSQTGGRMGDGGLFISADDVGGGGGRNAILMGAIGLPTFDFENGPGDEGGHHAPRRSGAQVRLLVGNHMLNRASTLLQRLEVDDAALAAMTASAAAAAASSSSGSGSGSSSAEGQNNGNENVAGLFLGDQDQDASMDIDIDGDDPNSLERVITQIVNASSTAALVAAVTQVQPGSGGPSQPQQPSSNSNSSSSTTGGTNPPAQGNPAAGSGADGTGASPNATPRRRPESPRLRELATALQDFLALQDRLNPFLRFVQDALRQNRLYNEPGETQSTQYVYDTISSVLHLLSHSIHAFSDIMCDFSITPEDRRLTAPSSILVEQSTVVRATIPVAVPAMLAAAGGGMQMPGGAAGNGSVNFNNPAGVEVGATGQPPSGANMMMGNPLAGLGFTLPMGQMQMQGQGGGSMPISFSMPLAGMQMPPGILSGQPWRNPNLQTTNAPPNFLGGNANAPQATPNPPTSQAQQPNVAGGPNPAAAAPPTSGNNQQQQQQLPAGLPAGLQNLGALLGMAGGGSVNVNLFAGPGGGAGGGGFLPQFGNFRMVNNNNNNAGSGAATGAAGATPSAVPPNASQNQQNSTAINGSGGGVPGANNANGNANGGLGMLQNLLRGDRPRSHIDALLPCHTYHSSSRFPRANLARPAEYRQFINVENLSSSLNSGQVEGESLEIVMDLLRNSTLIDWLQPVIRDVVLNYLMRGRDPKNDAHVKTCAKGLAKKLLPFFEKFSSKVEGRNESVDIPATYSNILTDFIASLMKKVIGGNGQFRTEVLNSLASLQKNLIQAFRLCYPSSANSGLLFVNYLVDQCLGGMSILFKNQTRQKLIEHLKQVEQVTGAGDASSPFIVYKPQESVAEPSSTTAATPSPSPAPVSGNVASASTSASLLSNRCGASFGNASSSSSGVDVGPASSSSTPVKKEPAKSGALPIKVEPMVSDDLDIDEVLQLPPTMAQRPVAPPRRSAGAAGGLPNQTEPLTALIRNLPSEWEGTIVQDVRRQRDMPPQPSFSPGFNTLFPRKH